VFTKIHMHFVVRGKELKPSMVESAIKPLAQQILLGSICSQNAQISHDYEILSD